MRQIGTPGAGARAGARPRAAKTVARAAARRDNLSLTMAF
jgi:hypothetical protein